MMAVDALMVEAGEGPSRASVWYPQNEPVYTSTVEGKSLRENSPLISPARRACQQSVAELRPPTP